MQFRQIHYRLHGSYAEIVLNRPEVCNALNEEIYTELEMAIDDLEKQEAVRAVVLTGAGAAFCSGADLEILSKATPSYFEKALIKVHRLFERIEKFPYPVIAAVNGIAVGGGVELALACDIRIAAGNAKFMFPETKLGIVPDLGGTQRLTRLVGVGQAKRLIYTSQLIDASEALRIGLVEEVTEPGCVQERAVELAINIAEKGPLSLRLAKQSINIASQQNQENGLAFERISSIMCCYSDDLKEGIAALTEKRRPFFLGK